MGLSLEGMLGHSCSSKLHHEDFQNLPLKRRTLAREGSKLVGSKGLGCEILWSCQDNQSGNLCGDLPRSDSIE